MKFGATLKCLDKQVESGIGDTAVYTNNWINLAKNIIFTIKMPRQEMNINRQDTKKNPICPKISHQFGKHFLYHCTVHLDRILREVEN